MSGLLDAMNNTLEKLVADIEKFNTELSELQENWELADNHNNFILQAQLTKRINAIHVEVAKFEKMVAKLKKDAAK
jgi:hypothetical protein